MTPRASSLQVKKDKFDFIQIKNLCSAVNKIEMWATGWEVILANHITDSYLYPENITEEILCITSHKRNTQ